MALNQRSWYHYTLPARIYISNASIRGKEGIKMRIMIKEPEKDPRTIVIDHSLRTLQDLVGGYIEHVPFFVLGTGLIINEEGKLRDLPYNFSLYGDSIVGNALFVGEDGEEFTDLTDEQVDSIRAAFALVETVETADCPWK